MHRNPGAFIAPALDEPMHAVVSAVISAPAQFLEQPLVERRSRFGSLDSCSRISVRTSTSHQARRRLNARAYLNSVLWLRMTLRTVARDTKACARSP